MFYVSLFLMPLPQNCSYPHSHMLSILAKYALLFCVYMFLIYAMALCQISHSVSFFSFSTTSYGSIPIAMSIPRPLLLTAVQHSKMDPHHIWAIQSSSDRHSRHLLPQIILQYMSMRTVWNIPLGDIPGRETTVQFYSTSYSYIGYNSKQMYQTHMRSTKPHFFDNTWHHAMQFLVFAYLIHALGVCISPCVNELKHL